MDWDHISLLRHITGCSSVCIVEMTSSSVANWSLLKMGGEQGNPYNFLPRPFVQVRNKILSSQKTQASDSDNKLCLVSKTKLTFVDPSPHHTGASSVSFQQPSPMADIYHSKAADTWTPCNISYLGSYGQCYNLTWTGGIFHPSIRLNNHHSSSVLKNWKIKRQEWRRRQH